MNMSQAAHDRVRGWWRRSARSRPNAAAIAILVICTDTKLRIGDFESGAMTLKAGAGSRSIWTGPGRRERVAVPHPEIFAPLGRASAAARRRQDPSDAAEVAATAVTRVEVGGE